MGPYYSNNPILSNVTILSPASIYRNESKFSPQMTLSAINAILKYGFCIIRRFFPPQDVDDYLTQFTQHGVFTIIHNHSSLLQIMGNVMNPAMNPLKLDDIVIQESYSFFKLGNIGTDDTSLEFHSDTNHIYGNSNLSFLPPHYLKLLIPTSSSFHHDFIQASHITKRLDETHIAELDSLDIGDVVLFDCRVLRRNRKTDSKILYVDWQRNWFCT